MAGFIDPEFAERLACLREIIAQGVAVIPHGSWQELAAVLGPDMRLRTSPRIFADTQEAWMRHARELNGTMCPSHSMFLLSAPTERGTYLQPRLLTNAREGPSTVGGEGGSSALPLTLFGEVHTIVPEEEGGQPPSSEDAAASAASTAPEEESYAGRGKVFSWRICAVPQMYLELGTQAVCPARPDTGMEEGEDSTAASVHESCPCGRSVQEFLSDARPIPAYMGSTRKAFLQDALRGLTVGRGLFPRGAAAQPHNPPTEDILFVLDEFM